MTTSLPHSDECCANLEHVRLFSKLLWNDAVVVCRLFFTMWFYVVFSEHAVVRVWLPAVEHRE